VSHDGRLAALVKRHLPRLVNLLVQIQDASYRLRLRPQVFIDVYARNAWGGVESRSGSGSTLEQTTAIRAALPRLFADLGVRSLLDVPCGDHHWMKEVPLDGIDYTGIDVVPAMIERNQTLYGGPHKKFVTGDLLRMALLGVDLVFSRHCLGHLPSREILAALGNIKRSGSTYLLATTFPRRTRNEELNRFGWRPLNLELDPFGLPAPRLLIDERCTERNGRYADKSLGLWRTSDLPD